MRFSPGKLGRASKVSSTSAESEFSDKGLVRVTLAKCKSARCLETPVNWLSRRNSSLLPVKGISSSVDVGETGGDGIVQSGSHVA